MEVGRLQLQYHLKSFQLFLLIIDLIEEICVLNAILQGHAFILLLIIANELSEFVTQQIDI